MKYLPLNSRIFSQNRERFVSRMEKQSIAIFVSNDEVPVNGDAIYSFKQNSDLFWLSGITQEDSMVILFPDNPDPKFREVLVLVRPNELKEKWDGKRLRVAEAKAISGMQTANSSIASATSIRIISGPSRQRAWPRRRRLER